MELSLGTTASGIFVADFPLLFRPGIAAAVRERIQKLPLFSQYECARFCSLNAMALNEALAALTLISDTARALEFCTNWSLSLVQLVATEN